MPLQHSNSQNFMLDLTRTISGQLSSSDATDSSDFSNDRLGKTRVFAPNDACLASAESGMTCRAPQRLAFTKALLMLTEV